MRVEKRKKHALTDTVHAYMYKCFTIFRRIVFVFDRILSVLVDTNQDKSIFAHCMPTICNTERSCSSIFFWFSWSVYRRYAYTLENGLLHTCTQRYETNHTKELIDNKNDHLYNTAAVDPEKLFMCPSRKFTHIIMNLYG